MKPPHPKARANAATAGAEGGKTRQERGIGREPGEGPRGPRGGSGGLRGGG